MRTRPTRSSTTPRSITAVIAPCMLCLAVIASSILCPAVAMLAVPYKPHTTTVSALVRVEAAVEVMRSSYAAQVAVHGKSRHTRPTRTDHGSPAIKQKTVVSVCAPPPPADDGRGGYVLLAVAIAIAIAAAASRPDKPSISLLAIRTGSWSLTMMNASRGRWRRH